MEDDVCLSLALYADSGRPAFGFDCKARTLGCSDVLNALTLNLRLLEHRSDELLLVT